MPTKKITKKPVVSTTPVTGNHDDPEYSRFLGRVQARFLKNCENGERPLFTTDVDTDELWEVYLDSFDRVERQHHNCNACKHFIKRFGGLVVVNDDGSTTPVMWDSEDAYGPYSLPVDRMRVIVQQAKVTGVFLSEDRTLGTPRTGVWTHLAVTQMSSMIFNHRLLTAGQAMAEKREDFKTLCRALEEFSMEHLNTALKLLRSELLYRGEKVLGHAEWLHDLHSIDTKGRTIARRKNLVWVAVAKAPAGFCHPRSSMIGTLLEDIAAGKSFEAVSRAFKAKMDPLQYQRPQAAPTAGAIAAAEKVVEKLGIENSLRRRFAQLHEVQALWKPRPVKKGSEGGVFGHLKPKDRERAMPGMGVPAKTMTWDKFQRTVLPEARRIELLVPSSGNFAALVTAADMSAPPIIQWDLEENRNPVSWYLYSGGSRASQWNLISYAYVEVEAVTLKPSMWNGGFEHQGEGVLFILADARDSVNGGLALFPEILKSELHAVRSTIEAHSRRGRIEGLGEPHAAGLLLNKNDRWNTHVRVWDGSSSLDYILDRWD